MHLLLTIITLLRIGSFMPDATPADSIEIAERIRKDTEVNYRIIRECGLEGEGFEGNPFFCQTFGLIRVFCIKKQGTYHMYYCRNAKDPTLHMIIPEGCWEIEKYFDFNTLDGIYDPDVEYYPIFIQFLLYDETGACRARISPREKRVKLPDSLYNNIMHTAIWFYAYYH